MFSSEMLEVAIGIIFIYMLVSTICSAIREGIEAFLKTRAAYLEYGIRELLHDVTAEGLAKSFFNHPLIYSLFSYEYRPSASAKRPGVLARGDNLPSYIPARNFAIALMDIAARGPGTDAFSSDSHAPVVSTESIRTNILNIQNPAVQRVLLTAVDSAKGDLDKARENISEWYDSAMDRVSGWYKRSTQWIIFVIALVLAWGFNVNTIALADFLYRNEGVRAALVARAEEAAKNTELSNPTYEQAKEDLFSLGLPIGRTPTPQGGDLRPFQERFAKDWVLPLFGWLLTAFAATLGAPFWFDVLNKVMVIRATVKPKEKSPEEASEDRQRPAPRTTETVIERQAPPEVAGGVVPGAAAGPTAGATPPQPVEEEPGPTDHESDLDGCDVDIVDETPDEDLPAAEGGVA